MNLICECNNENCNEKVIMDELEYIKIIKEFPRQYIRSNKCKMTDGRIIENRETYHIYSLESEK
jgi:hypothetical protein